ncbi:MAG: NB-ARC domain-containing protein [Chloroflexota bacterium]
MIGSTFGKLLKKYRKQARHPETKGFVSQGYLASLIDGSNNPTISASMISRWETGSRKVSRVERQTMLRLVYALRLCDGLTYIKEANALLEAGLFGTLISKEVEQINSWLNGKILKFDYSTVSPTPPPSFGAPLNHVAPSFMAPALPEHGIFGRDQFLSKIYNELRLNEANHYVPPLALRGMGGIGKTTLSIAISRLDLIQKQFPDGILWTALGETPTVRLELDRWGRALGIDLLAEPDELACVERLRATLLAKRVLIIVDDVWDINSGRYFSTIGGLNCRTIVTTRDVEIAQNLATRNRTLRVDLLSPNASFNLLTHLVPEMVADPKSAKLLCERLEFLPLALTLAGRLLADEADVPSRMRRIVTELIERREARLQLVQPEGRLGSKDDNPISLQAMLGLSVDRLDKIDLERFAMSAVFGGAPLTWDINAAAYVWDCSVDQAEATTSRLIKKGLVERVEGERYWMNTLLVDYAKELMEEMNL